MKLNELEPLGSRVLVRRREAIKQTKGGIYVPEIVQDKESPQDGIIISVSEDCFSDDEVPRFCDGDKVIFSKYAGIVMTDDDGQEFVILDKDDIWIIVHED